MKGDQPTVDTDSTDKKETPCLSRTGFDPNYPSFLWPHVCGAYSVKHQVSAILASTRFPRMKSEKISELTTARLSIYLRCLNTLHSAGIKTISSQSLAEQFNLNSAQIRKDLGYFGEFGVRGVGYYVDDLRDHITKILGLDSPHRVGIVGAGRLGTALANYNGFGRSNFTVVALFDDAGLGFPAVVGLVVDFERRERGPS